MACTIAFNAAIVLMLEVESSPLYGLNASTADYNDWSLPLAERRFKYTDVEESLLFASVFAGCLLMFIPVAYCNQRFGVHKTHLVISVVVTLATAAMPLAATLGFPFILAVRLITGLIFTNLFPVVGAVVAQWAPASERGIFVSVLSGYIQMASMFSMPVSGYLEENVGWPSIFYVHAVCLGAITVGWALFYRDDPRQHPYISQKELAFIKSSKPPSEQNPCIKPPYTKMLRDPAVWAIFACVVGNFPVMQFGNTFLPMYLHSVLGYAPLYTGLLCTLPLFLQLVVMCITGFVTDLLPKVPDIHKVKCCNTLAFNGCALFLLAASFAGIENHTIAVALVVAAFCVLGINAGGFFKSVVLVSRQYSPIVMTGVQIFLCLTLFTDSFVVPELTIHAMFDEYKHVFWIYAAGLVISNAIFVLFAKAEPAEWTLNEPGKA